MTIIKLIEAPEWHYVDDPTEDPTFEPDITDVDVECDLCDNGIGWTEYTDEGPHGEELDGYRWVEYYEITHSGDHDTPTRLCEDCTVWVGEVGADVASHLENEGAEYAQRYAVIQDGVNVARGVTR